MSGLMDVVTFLAVQVVLLMLDIASTATIVSDQEHDLEIVLRNNVPVRCIN